MELTPWKVPHGPYMMEVACYLMEPILWNLPSGSYTMEVT